MDAGDDLDQRRLAGAVVAEQSHDLARREPEVDVAEDAGRHRTTSRLPQARGAGGGGAVWRGGWRGWPADQTSGPASAGRSPAVGPTADRRHYRICCSHERCDDVDVGLVDEAAAGVDEQTAEPVVAGSGTAARSPRSPAGTAAGR